MRIAQSGPKGREYAFWSCTLVLVYTSGVIALKTRRDETVVALTLSGNLRAFCLSFKSKNVAGVPSRKN
jgi:hypothetical protein